MSGIVLGIDLGTTNSVVALADGKKTQVLADGTGRRLIPSVVSFHPNGKIIVGEAGRDRRLIDALNTVYSVKRLIGRPFNSPEVERAQRRLPFRLVESPNGGVQVSVRDENYTLTEISAYVLREVRKVAEEVVGQPCRRAVITVPANFNELQRSATKAAGRVAGLDVLRIINEPTAAALAYGLGKSTAQKVAVYDLGGGTFDITILEMDGKVFEVVSTAGDSFLGGDDCDVFLADAMATHCLETHRWDPKADPQAYERLRAAAEWVKCSLSDQPEVEITVEELTYGPGGEPVHLDFKMNREELATLLQPLIARTFDVVQEALDGASMKPSDVESVILVGGSTRLPLVRTMVADYFGRAPEISIDPDLVVAQGAAIHGYSLAGEKSRKSLGRIKLKKLSANDVAKARQAREDVREKAPRQPAFAPPRAPAPVASAPVASGVMTLSEPGAFDGPDQPLFTGTTEPTPQASSATDNPTQLTQTLDELSLELDQLSSIVATLDLPDELVDERPPTPPSPGMAPPPPPPPPATPASSVPPGLPPSMSDSGPLLAPLLGAAHDDHLTPLPLDMSTANPTIGEFLEIPDTGSLTMATDEAPLLMDVTSHSFGVETAGGYCQHLIRRNAPIPAEQARVFTTAHDGQRRVTARVCQGESRQFEENQILGEIELENLRESARGDLRIGVRFQLNASGTLDVTARDLETGHEQSIRINLRGGLSEDDIAAMQARQQASAD